MKLTNLIEQTQQFKYYHGSPVKYDKYDMSIQTINRGSNIRGLYLTKNKDVALNYAGPSGFLYEVVVSVKKSFIDRKDSINQPAILKAYKEQLLRYTNYKSDWIDTAIIPDAIDENRLKRDLSGDIKRNVFIAAGYDSFIFSDMDGPVLVVLDEQCIISFNITKSAS